jgi:hypothetical protein
MKAHFLTLDPVRLLQEIRLAQQTLSDIASHGTSADVVAGTPAITEFVASLASAWKDGEARPTHRKQPKAKHWWRTRVDPFADAWPVVEGWLLAEPAVSAKVLMERLATVIPDMYTSKTQLRTLQRRVKAWRAERAKDMVLGRLRMQDAKLAET